MGFRRLRNAVLGFGILSVLGTVGPARYAAASGAPSVAFVSECTDTAPYRVRFVLSGFGPNQWLWGSAYQGAENIVATGGIRTDINGGLMGGVTGFTEPHSGWVRLYDDANEDRIHQRDEPLILAVTYTVDNPCENGSVAPK